MIKRYSITVNGKSYDVEVEELGNSTSKPTRPQAVQPSTPSVQSPKPVAPKNQPEKASGSGSICAPMPGTINDVKVKNGDSVKKGQVLLILEAMKMENEIMANCDGTVTAINVAKGASVSVGDVLVTIG